MNEFIKEELKQIQGMLRNAFKHADIHAEGMNRTALQDVHLRDQPQGKIVQVDRVKGLREIVAADDVLPEDAPDIQDGGGINREGGFGNPVQKNRHQLRREDPADQPCLGENGPVIHVVVRMRLDDQGLIRKEEIAADLIDGDLILAGGRIQIRKLLRKDQSRVIRNVTDGFQPVKMQNPALI